MTESISPPAGVLLFVLNETTGCWDRLRREDIDKLNDITVGWVYMGPIAEPALAEVSDG